MLCWMHKAGWSAENATTFVDSKGEELQILHGAPALLGKLLVVDLRAKLLKERVTKDLAKPAWAPAAVAQFAAEELWTLPVRQFAARSAATTADKFFVRAAWCGDYVTRTRLHEWGYNVSPLCPECETPDTLHHRVYVCPRGDEVRSQLVADRKVSRRLLERGKLENSERDPFFVRGWVVKPSYVAAPDADWDIRFLSAESGQLVEGPPFKFKLSEGPLFLDGSTFHPRIDVLARSGCAAVQTSRDGEILRVIRSSLPTPFAQTAVNSEHAAVTLANDHTEAEAGVARFDCYGDCSAVIKGWTKFASHGAYIPPSCLQGGFWRTCRSVGIKLGSVKKTAAHRSLEQVLATGSEQEALECRGNAFADAHCKLAAQGHEPPAGDIAAVNRCLADCREVFTLFSNVLPLWPPSRVSLGKLERARVSSGAKGGTPAGRPHSWTWARGAWQCKNCLRTKRRQCSTADSRPCVSMPEGLKNLFESGNPGGHSLRITQVGDYKSMLVFCQRCGAYAEQRAIKLLEPCEPKLVGFGVTALKRLGKFLHPKHPVPVKKPYPFHPAIFLASRPWAPRVGGGGGGTVCGGGGGGGGEILPSLDLGVSQGQVGDSDPRGNLGSPSGPAPRGELAASGLPFAVGPSGGLCGEGGPSGIPVAPIPWGDEEDDWMPLDGESLFT